MTDNLKNKLRNLPKSPGVYFHKDKTGEIIYVGKASNLKNRVKQYFQKEARGDDLPRDFPIRANELNPRLKIVGKAAASDEEVALNPRSRSAHLRIAQKLPMQVKG